MQRKSFSSTLRIVLIFTSLFMVAGLTQAQLAPPCCQLGDLNGDGEVTLDDLQLIEDHILELDCTDNACQGDLDGNGELDKSDLLLMRKYFDGLIQTFPRCGDIDGDGVLEWGSGGDDINCFTAIYLGNVPPNCRYFSVVDGNQDGRLDNLDFFAFADIANGLDSNAPVCACYEPYTP